VRLKSAKCTIGAGERSTLRLRARGVRPVHCLVLRGPGGTVIRRWDSDTRLNGRAFTDAELLPGDRLDVGAIGLEVLQTGGMPATYAITQPQTSPAQPPYPGLVDRRKLANLSARLQLANRQGRQRARRLLEQLRSLRTALNEARQTLELRQREQRATQDEEAAKLHQRAEQLDAQAAQLETQHTAVEEDRRQWDQQRAETQQQLTQRAEQLDAQAAQLETQHTAVEQDRRQWDLQKAKTQQQLTQRAEQLDAQAAQLETQRTAVEQDRRQWDLQKAETQQQLTQRAAELDCLASELAARQEAADQRDRQAELDRGVEQPGGERAPGSFAPPEPEFQAVDGAAPVDLAAVFRKLGASGVLREEQPDDAATPEPRLHESKLKPQEDQPAAEPPGFPGLPQPTHHGEEESIEDYMLRLFDRVRAGTGMEKSALVGCQGAPPLSSDRATPQAGDKARQESAFPSPAAPRRAPAEIAPRAVAPEKASGLTAMRELANLSAQTALSRHARRQMTRTSRIKLGVAAAGLVAGGLLTWMWWRNAAGPLVLSAALVSFVTALFWGLQYALLAGHMIFSRTRHFDRHSPRGEPREAPPAEREADAAGQQPAAGGSEPAAVTADQQ
jgi:hypothetical protein